ncbi:MAG: sigma-70 family RNA polymerase sigma factor [Thermoguttaceae bacterium]|nr:sigma-70 family RNA polymerase sigma factor [Thermoguttaceae bacterium]
MRREYHSQTMRHLQQLLQRVSRDKRILLAQRAEQMLYEIPQTPIPSTPSSPYRVTTKPVPLVLAWSDVTALFQKFQVDWNQDECQVHPESPTIVPSLSAKTPTAAAASSATTSSIARFFGDEKNLEGTEQGISTEVLRHDLGLLIEDVFDESDVTVEELKENVWTIEKLAEQFNVSTKTISRWRSQGLVSRRLVFPGGRKRVAFPESSVRCFDERNPDKVRRGSLFSQMLPEESEKILRLAKRFSDRGGCPSEVVRRVASMTNRSEEAVRYTILNHDQEHEDDAIFPDHNRRDGDVRNETKQQIYEQFSHGLSLEQLTNRYRCFSKTKIQRIITEVRLTRIMELPLDYFGKEEFEKIREGSKVEESILKPIASSATTRKSRVPSGLPPYLASLYELPLLSREQEYHLFRKMSYLRYRAAMLRDKLNPLNPRAAYMDEIERLYEASVAVKNQIIQSNLRLVVSIAKRHIASIDDFFELISDGNISLMRAAEKFDFTRGNKFSTYASWAIMKNFARTIPEELRRRDRSNSGELEFWELVDPSQMDPADGDFGESPYGFSLDKMLANLDEREQQIIRTRFGLGDTESPMTLTQVGQLLGITKERVRQIESRAIGKLRRAITSTTTSHGPLKPLEFDFTDQLRSQQATASAMEEDQPESRFSFFCYDMSNLDDSNTQDTDKD